MGSCGDVGVSEGSSPAPCPSSSLSYGSFWEKPLHAGWELVQPLLPRRGACGSAETLPGLG